MVEGGGLGCGAMVEDNFGSSSIVADASDFGFSLEIRCRLVADNQLLIS